MDEQIRVIIVDDDVDLRKALVRRLMHSGCVVEEAGDGREALAKLEEEQCDVALIDLKMPGMDGFELMQNMQEQNIDTVPVFFTGHGEIADAVVAMKRGAFEFIEKPSTSEIVVSAVHRAARHARVVRQARKMTQLAENWEAIFANCPDLIQVVDGQLRELQQSFDDIALALRKFSELVHYAQSGPVDPKLVEEAKDLIVDAGLDRLTEAVPRTIEQALEHLEQMAKLVRSVQ